MKKKWIKRIDLLFLFTIFSLLIYLVPGFYLDKFKSEKYFSISIEALESVQLSGNSNSTVKNSKFHSFSKFPKNLTKDSQSLEKNGLIYLEFSSSDNIDFDIKNNSIHNTKDLNLYMINEFKERFLIKNQNLKDKFLIKYIIELILSQQEEISSYKIQINKTNLQKNEKDIDINILNKEKSFTSLSPNPRSKPPSNLSDADKLNIKIVPENIKIAPGTILKEKTHSKPTIKIFQKIFFKYTNFIFLGFLLVTCFIISLAYILKNKKIISLTQLFLIIISVTTCLASGNHLFFTVPEMSSLNIISFDLVIFSLGPLAVIWLSIKSIIELF